MAEKTCTKCKKTKSVSEFYRRGKGWQSRCKACSNEDIKAWRAANPDKDRENQKRWRESPSGQRYRANRPKREGDHLMRRYGITVEDRARMVEEQQGLCAICEKERPLVVDHCHDTGQVRGMLCVTCNLAIGYFEDDVEALRRAIAYLAA